MYLESKAFSVAAEPFIQLNNRISGADALRGHTRTHPEHDG